jgi:hypothetical protein
MKISAKISVVMAAIFASICFGVAIKGFTSLGDIGDPAQLEDARGFAWFWTFLGALAVLFGAIGVWIVKTQKDGNDGE